jgi:hypothetical protein
MCYEIKMPTRPNPASGAEKEPQIAIFFIIFD